MKSSINNKKSFILCTETTRDGPYNSKWTISNDLLDLTYTCVKGNILDLPNWHALHKFNVLSDLRVLFIVDKRLCTIEEYGWPKQSCHKAPLTSILKRKNEFPYLVLCVDSSTNDTLYNPSLMSPFKMVVKSFTQNPLEKNSTLISIYSLSCFTNKVFSPIEEHTTNSIV